MVMGRQYTVKSKYIVAKAKIYTLQIFLLCIQFYIFLLKIHKRLSSLKLKVLKNISMSNIIC